MSRKYRYLTLEDRRNISIWYLNGECLLEIAMKIGVHTATIYTELHRGYTGKLDQNQRPDYDPELAQWTVQRNIRKRGRTKYKTTDAIDGQYELPVYEEMHKKI